MTESTQLLTLGQIARQLDDKLDAVVVGDESVVVNAVSTDSRSITPGQTFVALQGPNHDAHTYLNVVVDAGAAAVVVDRETSTTVPQLLVKDTRIALGQMAEIWCRHHAAKRVAVTGSNGKTTVKEMIAAILRQSTMRKCRGSENELSESSHDVLATPGNLNNDIGLPLTCLSIRSCHRYAVLEMGTSGVGEIAYLSQIAAPEVALVNNIAAAHLQGFGTLEKIAREKASIFSGLSDQGLAVFAEGSPFDSVLRDASSHCRVLTFGESSDAGVRLRVENASAVVEISDAIDSPLAGSQFEFSLQLPGQHNYTNALAAIAVSCAFDVTVTDIVDGLASVQAVPGRLQLRQGTPARLIDDTYNANPASLNAAIDLLASYKGRRVLVLGDMKELGSDELELHAEAGRYAKAAGIDLLMSVGALAAHAAVGFGENAVSHTTKESLVKALQVHMDEQHTILFKGSRGARMEEVIALLIEAHEDDSSSTDGQSTGGGTSGVGMSLSTCGGIDHQVVCP